MLAHEAKLHETAYFTSGALPDVKDSSLGIMEFKFLTKTGEEIEIGGPH
jgi:hypothetical protein